MSNETSTSFALWFGIISITKASFTPSRADLTREDVTDVISIRKLMRKNNGPDEIAQIIKTMINYGDA
jgi:hypothetical protein